MAVWKRIREQKSGFIYDISDSMSLLDWRYPGIFTPVSKGVMVTGSDYSGQHRDATHEAYSFIVTTDRDLVDWVPKLAAFRSHWLPDGRRISFKKLNKQALWRALRPFLDTASELRGNVVTVLIDSRIPHFSEGGAAALREALPECFSQKTPLGTIEKMFRLASLMSMILAGFRREGQESIWISDHDETLDNFDRREQFAQLSAYLAFAVTGWRNPADQTFLTTEYPSVPFWAEDLLAIPDLLAGMYCNLAPVIPKFLGAELWSRIVPSTVARDRRALAIANQLCLVKGALQHILVRLELDSEGVPRSSAQFFAGALPGELSVWRPT